MCATHAETLGNRTCRITDTTFKVMQSKCKRKIPHISKTEKSNPKAALEPPDFYWKPWRGNMRKLPMFITGTL